MTEQNTNLNDESPVVSKDESINLEAFMSNVDTTEIEEKISPLDAAVKVAPNLGEVGNTDEIIKDAGPKVFKNAVFNEERDKEFSEKNNEVKDLAERAKRVHIINKPTHKVEDAVMMDELAMLIENEDGTLSFPNEYNPLYIVPYTKEELDKRNAGEEVKAINPDIITNKQTEESDDESKKKYERESVLKIIIDKTGLGNNISFDDEENKYIEKSEEIHIVEVETKEMETIVYDRNDENEAFLANIDRYQLSISKTPMVFPGSGFKADMTGLSYGDFADITLDVSPESDDALDFDKIYKKLTVIYNNMINVSSGKFKSFTDFLKNFAFIDMPLATFGLLISTQPEIDTLALKCNRDTCNKQFNHQYSIRSLIDFDSASDKYLELVKKISVAPPEEYVSTHEKSMVRRTKSVKLPQCGYIIDFGLASCHDYLYGILSILKEYRESDMDEEDIRNILLTLITTIRGIRIPQSNGKYVVIQNAKDIVETIAREIPPQDMQIIYNIHTQFTERYEIEFSVRDVKCPHCGAETKAIAMTPDELVFRIHQRMLSTPITLDNFLDF